MDVVVKQEQVSSWPDIELNRACEWCSAPDYMRTQIQEYVEKPLDEWRELLLDLCDCYDCVQEYHRLAEELIGRDRHFRKKFQALDIERLTLTITKALEGPPEAMPGKLQAPLMEILCYPYLLHHKQLADLFVEGMIAVFTCGYPLKLEVKVPGAYLLLVHPRREVRAWADRVTRSLGLISPDDYDSLGQVIKWIVQIVQLGFDIGEPEHKDELPFDYLPTHLYFPLVTRDYWRGLVVLVMRMEVSTLQSCFMSSDDNGHRGFLEIILPTMKCQTEEDGTFWHILQCFVALLEKLGERIWQMPEFKFLPGDVFNIITENTIYRNYIQQRQEEREVSPSQEACRDSSKPWLSSSSCRSYKTALAWFKPFAQSLLVFDSGGEHVSEVVRYLHNVADPCLFQSSFRHEVQSSLLTVICDLFTQGLLQLLVPTVRLWAMDMVDVAISGSLDNRCKGELSEEQRMTFERDRNLQDLLELPVVLRVAQKKLQDILEYCHRRGFKNAIEYYELLNRRTIPRIPERDKQEIISLVIQRFEEDTQGLQFPLQPAIQISSSKVQELMESENKNHVIQMPQGLHTQPNVPLEEVQASVVFEGRRLAHEDAGPIKSLTPENQRKEKQGKVSAISDNQRSADINAEVTAPSVTSERRKRKIDPTVLSWGKAGPSSRMSSSEDEVEEKQYWEQIKRRKKLKHPFGKLRISNKSGGMLGNLLQARVQLDDYRRKGKRDQDLLPARKKDVAPTLFKVKTAMEDHNVPVKKETKLKRIFSARKSSGRLKNLAFSQQMQGVTPDNPIVLSDDEDSADEISVQKKPLSFTDMKMTDKSDKWSEGLSKMVDKHSTSESDVLKLEPEIPELVLSNSLKGTIAEIPKNLDEDLYFSVFDEKATSSSSLETPALDVSFPELKTGKSNSNISHAVQGERLNKPDTILYPELMDAEENDNVNILAEVDSVMNETSGDKQERLNDGSDDKPLNLEVNPVSILRDEDRTLSSISGQLDNHALDNSINFWDHHSEFIWNSQDNALKSIEDDLEDLDSTYHQDIKNSGSGLDNKPLSQRDHLNKALQSEGADAVKSNVKRVKFGDNVSQADVAASCVATVASPTDRPAVTTPGKELTDDEFFHEVVSWNVAHLEYPKNKGKNTGLPHNFPVFPMPEKEGFDSMDQYYETLKPLLFMEIWAKAVHDWWNKEGVKKRVFMDVLDGSTSNELSLIPCSGIISQEQNNKTLFPMESDLVVVRFIGSNFRDSEQLRYGVAVFGVVETAKVKPVQSTRRASTGSLEGDDVAEPPKFHLTLNIKTSSKFRPPRKSCLQVEYVTSLLTALRQWVGLMNIPKSLLACDILKPRKADYFCLNDPHSSIDSKEYNESQKKVISTASNAVHLPYPIPRICLVQGPPGTGKSNTIVGLVKEILNRPRDFATPTAAGPAVLANKCRILLCAPSNAAIDELIGQIERAQIRLNKTHNNKENRRSNRQRAHKEGTLNNCGDLCLVRVGRKSQVHSSVIRFWLDNLTKEAQSKSSTSSRIIPAIKEEIRDCDASQTKLEQQIWHLKNFGPDNVIELNELEDQMTSLKNRKKALQSKYRMEKDKQSNLRREEARIRRKILDSADVICTTLSGSGSTTLKNDLGRRHLPFTCVIVDEACQSTELDLLIPLGFKASKLVLVGDPEQLPPTVFSEKAKTNSFDRSMFQRLQRFFRHHEMGRPVFMLEEQYRMHPQIAAFPSRHVYSGRLKSHSTLETRPFPLKTRYAVFDVYRGQEICHEKGSLQNPAEVALIIHVCTFLTKVLHQECVGIITPYRKQKAEIEKRLKDWDLSKIEVDTVDGFQGREKDVIILSCVRAKSSHGSIGFVSDKRRMNVALTRARHALYVFGDMETLKNGSKDWKALIADAVGRKCIFRDQFAQDVVSRLSIGSTHDGRSSPKDPQVKTKVPLARGSDAPPLEVPDNLIHCDERVDDKDISTLPKKAFSVSVSEKHKSVPVIVKGKALVKTGGGALSRKKVTWADLSDQKSTDDDPVKPEAKELAKNAASEVKRGKQGDTSRHSHHQKNLQDRHDTSRHTHNDHGHNHRHHGDRQSSKGEHSASLSDVQERVGTDAAKQQSDANHSSNSERRRSRQDKQHHVAVGIVSNTKEMDCSRTFDMAVRKSSFAGNDQSSTTTRSLYGNSSSNGEQINDDTLHLDTAQEDCTRDPVLTSVIENNRSHPAGYYLQLHQQEMRSGGRLPAVVTSSVSRRPSSETASNSTLPRTPLPYSGQSLAKLSSSHLTRSVTPLVPSATTVSGVSTEGSSPSSSFSAPEPSNKEASSTSTQSSPGLGSRTIPPVVSQHQLPRDIQEKVDAVKQRHPLPRGPQIIEARALTGLRNPYGAAKRRTAHIQGRDDSSLRERALDGPLRTERRNSNAGPRIDKTKYSKNFRGRINWHSR